MKLNMEDHNDTCDKRGNSVNIMREKEFVTSNIDVAASEDELNSPHGKSSKKMKYSATQIQDLEVAFKENSHPDKTIRLELATKLSIDSTQVQYWFQNKRALSKSQLKRRENEMLKQENNKLHKEYISMKKVMKNPICGRCHNKAIIMDINVDERQTTNEHARLKDGVKKITIVANKVLGPSELLARRNEVDGINIVDAAKIADFEKSMSSPPPVISLQPTISLVNDDVTLDKSILMNLALDASDELLRLGMSGEPLWRKSLDGDWETLDLKEYDSSFIPIIGMKPTYFTTEATRTSCIMVHNGPTLVETLMDKNRWVDMFPCIVGKTNTVDVISTGIGENKSVAMLLIKSELQIISELVPVREIKFLRFCHKRAEGLWVVVDVSIDTIKKGSQQCEISNCRRLPSGCIVQDMFNGYSKVTWIEHMEYNENHVHHLYRSLIKTGLGFGAQRWIASLQRQSEFLRVMKSFVDPTIGSKDEIGIWMLAQRMTRNFCAGVCSTTHKWKIIQLENGENAKLMMRTNTDDLGEPIGIVLSATKTIRLPVKQQYLFEFFINNKTRSQWDILSHNGPMQQLVHVSKGQNLNSSISLLCANGDSTSANQNGMMIFQDACTDATGSLIVYAAIDSQEINMVMKGGDSSFVNLLPNGISIVQDCSTADNDDDFFGKKGNGACSGSLVTIGFQILVNNLPSTNLPVESIKTANDLISHTIHKIKTALKCK